MQRYEDILSYRYKSSSSCFDYRKQYSRNSQFQKICKKNKFDSGYRYYLDRQDNPTQNHRTPFQDSMFHRQSVLNNISNDVNQNEYCYQSMFLQEKKNES